jgi:hypothetical protein
MISNRGTLDSPLWDDIFGKGICRLFNLLISGKTWSSASGCAGGFMRINGSLEICSDEARSSVVAAIQGLPFRCPISNAA